MLTALGLVLWRQRSKGKDMADALVIPLSQEMIHHRDLQLAKREKTRCTMQLLNDTQETVQIVRVRGNCACKRSPIENASIAPGQSLEFHYEVDQFPVRSSSDVHYMEFETSNRKVGLKLTLHYPFFNDVLFRPVELHFGGSAKTKSLIIQIPAERQVAFGPEQVILDRTLPVELLGVERLGGTKDYVEFAVRLALKERIAAGGELKAKHEGHVTIRIGDEAHRIPVYWQ